MYDGDACLYPFSLTLMNFDALPPQFARTVTSVFGNCGIEWLIEFPILLNEFSSRWSLTVSQPFDLSYNFVAPATLPDGTEVVLKAGVPNPELSSEVAALRAYAGRGAVRLLEADPVRGMMLLERVSPGGMLSEVEDDEEATRIAAGVMRALRCKPPVEHTFPHIADWARGMERLRARYDGGTGPFPRRLVEEAEALWKELIASQAPPVLLHGDLHHFNMLRRTGVPPALQWVAIDPKGVIGEAEYEVGALLRNPDPQFLARQEAVQTQTRRIEILAEELGFDRSRLRDWAVAQGVLSVWWGVEDHGEMNSVWLAVVERLAEARFP